MPAEWQSFLQAQGARIAAGYVLDFGAPEREATAAQEGNIITDLSYLAVIKITGTDAAGFLQGQFSSDIKTLADGGVQPSAWCNPKGQVLASFLITRRHDDYILLLPGQMQDGFIKRLRMYVLRANVTIAGGGQSLRCLGIKHEGELSPLSRVLPDSATTGSAVSQGERILVPMPISSKRWIMIGSDDALRETWPKLTQTFTPVGSHYWELFDIVDGLPWIGDATKEAFLPQFLNMDCMQTVSFNKGCFPGQEVVARLQHRGKVKQRMMIVNMDNTADARPGAKVYRNGEEQSVGTIINSARHPAGSMSALAVLDTDHGVPERLHLKNNPARFLQIIPPPYLILP